MKPTQPATVPFPTPKEMQDLTKNRHSIVEKKTNHFLNGQLRRALEAQAGNGFTNYTCNLTKCFDFHQDADIFNHLVLILKTLGFEASVAIQTCEPDGLELIEPKVLLRIGWENEQDPKKIERNVVASLGDIMSAYVDAYNDPSKTFVYTWKGDIDTMILFWKLIRGTTIARSFNYNSDDETFSIRADVLSNY